MSMPKKIEELKNPSVSVSLTPELVKKLNAERIEGETRSAQFRRLLEKALRNQN